MATKTETQHTAGFIVSEANGNRSRKKVTLLAAETTGNLVAGTVIGEMSAPNAGTYGAYDNSNPAAVDGILVESVDASASDVEATIIVRDAEVNEDELTIGGDATSITAAGDELAALGIIYR